MPETVREQADKELARFERMGESSPESQMIRSYLDWLLAVPWGTRSDEVLDPERTREILDTDHAGLEDVKDRIVEYIAVAKLRKERGIEPDKRAGAILTLIGPPGTGKTSIGESVAKALNREFVRMSLGGVRDEAEIRGHRRTYIGALPGRLVRALRDAKTMNPVILLDEVDKVGADWRGDPSAALLEVLDPAQNSTFRDHYLDVEVDLSQVFFIATANIAETIPGPLLDRMEVIRFDGYTTDEKVAIARGYLWPRQRRAGGAPRRRGVDLRRRARDGDLRVHARGGRPPARARARRRSSARPRRRSSPTTAEPPVEVDVDAVRDALGRQKFFREAAERTAVPGVATGPRRQRDRRRRALRRGDRGAGRGARAHGPARRRDEGVGADRALRGALAGRPARDRGRTRSSGSSTSTCRPGRSRRTVRAPASRWRRRSRRSSRGRPGEAHGRHDRRADAPGSRAPDRRPQAEGARRARRRADARRDPRAQPGRSRRRPRARPRRADVPSGDVARRGARARPRAGAVDARPHVAHDAL